MSEGPGLRNDGLTVRAATRADAPAIARIYNEGIAERTSTFETRPRTAAEIEDWFDGRHPIVVAESAGEVAAFASTSSYRARDCYRGVADSRST
jgi:phosphinothricin acetyltransferase